MKKLLFIPLLAIAVMAHAQLQHLPTEEPMAVMLAHTDLTQTQINQGENDLLKYLGDNKELTQIVTLIQKIHIARKGDVAAWMGADIEKKGPQIVVVIPIDSLEQDFLTALQELMPKEIEPELEQWNDGWRLALNLDNNKLRLQVCVEQNTLILSANVDAKVLMHQTKEPAWAANEIWKKGFQEVQHVKGVSCVGQINGAKFKNYPGVYRFVMLAKEAPVNMAYMQFYCVDNPKQMDNIWDMLVALLNNNDKVLQLQSAQLKGLVIPSTKKPDYGYLDLEQLATLLDLKKQLNIDSNTPVELPKEIILQYNRKKTHTLVINVNKTFKL